jgi:hypothetical protein
MPQALTADEIAAFHENGYHAPLRVMSAAQALHYRGCLERFTARYPDDVNKLDQGASLLCPWVDELIRLPNLLDAMADLIGPDILCWGVTLRLKQPDAKTFAGWHQDTAYSDIKPIVVIAALALSGASTESGGVRVIPGSHKTGVVECDTNHYVIDPSAHGQEVPCEVPAGHREGQCVTSPPRSPRRSSQGVPRRREPSQIRPKLGQAEHSSALMGQIWHRQGPAGGPQARVAWGHGGECGGLAARGSDARSVYAPDDRRGHVG